MYSGGCSHLDDWISIVEKGEQKTNKEMKLLVQLVKTAIASQDVYVDIKKINDCIEFIEKYRPYKLTPIHGIVTGKQIGRAHVLNSSHSAKSRMPSSA